MYLAVGAAEKSVVFAADGLELGAGAVDRDGAGDEIVFAVPGVGLADDGFVAVMIFAEEQSPFAGVGIVDALGVFVVADEAGSFSGHNGEAFERRVCALDGPDLFFFFTGGVGVGGEAGGEALPHIFGAVVEYVGRDIVAEQTIAAVEDDDTFELYIEYGRVEAEHALDRVR